MDSQTSSASLSARLADSMDCIRDMMGKSSDFVNRELTLHCGRRAAVLYLDGMVETHALQQFVIASLLRLHTSREITVSFIKDSVLDAGDIHPIKSAHEAIERILTGGVLFLLDGEPEGLVISLPGWEERSVSESKTQPVIRGPRDAFTETLRTNTTLVRRRVKDSKLQVTSLKVGKCTKTDVAIVYLRHLADIKLVEQITKQLSMVQEDEVLEGEYLEEILHGKKQVTIFPMLYNTDRPDTVAAGILDGKIAIFIDGTPFVLLAPTLFVDFLQSAEDYYQPYFYSSLIRLLRYGALFACMLAPSIYIALTTFHQDMLPTQLLLSLVAQREGIPFPAFVEALLMEVTFEILREAGIRMPRTIGQAVSIVGTIVIGQAAVEASIVSAAMVIIVAITGIASFVIPTYAMSIPIRIARFVFMGLAAAFGSYGLTIGFLILIAHLSQLHSFGVPYMSPAVPYRDDESDAILRYPYWHKSRAREKRRQPL